MRRSVTVEGPIDLVPDLLEAGLGHPGGLGVQAGTERVAHQPELRKHGPSGWTG